MDITQKTVISLIKSALYGEKTVLPEGFDEEEFKFIIYRHNIWGLMYYGLYNSGIKVPNWLTLKFQINVALTENLWHKSEETCEKLKEKGIEYVPLKGIVLKDLYPSPYMRHMSDIDILIYEKDYKSKIKPLMLSLGYTEGNESDHELHWYKDKQLIEFHKRIIPSYNKDFYKVIGDGHEWVKDHEYEYIFTHFAKHYRDSGIGIIHLVDLEVLKEKATDEGLKELNLTTFYENVQRTLDCWFRDREFDDVTMKITDTIFNSGEYGTKEILAKSQALKQLKAANGDYKKARVNDFLNRLFPPYNVMKMRNPILIKLPVLLPFLWVWRIVSSVFTDKVQKGFRANKNILASNEYRNELTAVGLDYWF